MEDAVKSPFYRLAVKEKSSRSDAAMSQVNTKLKLLQTKLALVAKYENLAQIAGSQPKRKKFLHAAERYRGQAKQLAQK